MGGKKVNSLSFHENVDSVHHHEIFIYRLGNCSFNCLGVGCTENKVSKYKIVLVAVIDMKRDNFGANLIPDEYSK